ncbi:MAG: AroB-related putative sugar phosphate phospholyase (cyclizing) [Holophaga sp.]
MSEGFSVQSIFRTYSVAFDRDFPAALRGALRDGDVVLVDRQVRDLFPGALEGLPGTVRVLALDATEEQKSYENLVWILEDLIEQGFRKNHRLVAIGGGIVQDATAFIASILYRGVDWLFFPTTLLAQCDSCIGSKTSINFRAYKNQVGNFYPPAEIHICEAFLDTLPELAIRSGIGEMAHYFLVSGEADYRLFGAALDRCRADRDEMRRLIRRSLEIKKSYIERDEFDRGPRQVFNYGHSFGHALESVTHYAIPHGVAVSFGMDIANFISSRLGLIPSSLRDEIRGLLARIWAGSSVDGVDVRAFEQALGKDKKNVGNELRVILTRGLGAMFKSPLALDAKVSGWLDEWFRDWRKP